MPCTGYENFEFRISDFQKQLRKEFEIRQLGVVFNSEIRNPKSEILLMPEPQIARRCRSCGVSIRVPASFCPQCGKSLTSMPDAAIDIKDTEPLTSGPENLDVTDKSALAETKPLNLAQAVTPPTASSTSASASRRQPMQATVGMVQRTGPPPREVIGEDGLNRVEKFRQMSGAMIDEAAYDPSLRFVLVAAVLFVLFLGLLLLSELLT